MTYSCALFEDGDDLHDAQLRKVDSILDQAGVSQGTRLLEIGSGWGELAVRAARRGADVTTITLSQEQQRAVLERAALAAVGNRVRALVQDYRQVEGQYDAIVSVEMLEAVGAEYWRTYIAALDRLLVPGGRAVLQVITMPHDRMLVNRNVQTWIQKYVFPGGQVPSIRAIEEEINRTALRTITRRRLGHHYTRTLAQWRDRFDANQQRIRGLGFDATFQRMWRYYLGYSEAGFRAAFLDVWQICLLK
jgi:cyclopropane-fatty-acyl-phospholipid synthase